MVQLNTQSPVTTYNKNGLLEVHSTFLTIQGEGPLVGTPCVFIRMYGCNLQCPMCDTDYTSSKNQLSPKELTTKVEKLAKGKVKTVVITGGEPLQQDLSALVDLLFKKGFLIQIETNGTCFNDLLDYKKCIVVCSPKTKNVHKRLKPHINYYKYVGCAESLQEDGLPSEALGNKIRGNLYRPREDDIIYLQPLDEKDEVCNKNNLNAVIDSCLENGYKLCLQTHKIINVE